MEEEERARIEAEAMRKQDVENRLKALEGQANMFKMAVFGAGATILANLWEQLQGVMGK